MTSRFYTYVVATVLVTCALNIRGSNALKLQLSTKKACSSRVHPEVAAMPQAASPSPSPSSQHAQAAAEAQRRTGSGARPGRVMAAVGGALVDPIRLLFKRAAVRTARVSPNTAPNIDTTDDKNLPSVQKTGSVVGRGTTDDNTSPDSHTSTNVNESDAADVYYIFEPTTPRKKFSSFLCRKLFRTVVSDLDEKENVFEQESCPICLEVEDEDEGNGEPLAFQFVPKAGRGRFDGGCCAHARCCTRCAHDIQNTVPWCKQDVLTAATGDAFAGFQPNGHGPCPYCKTDVEVAPTRREIGDGLIDWEFNREDMREGEPASDLFRINSIDRANTIKLLAADNLKHRPQLSQNEAKIFANLDVLEREVVQLADIQGISRNAMLHTIDDLYKLLEERTSSTVDKDGKPGLLLRVIPTPPLVTERIERYSGMYYLYFDLLCDLIFALHPDSAGKLDSKTGIRSKMKLGRAQPNAPDAE